MMNSVKIINASNLAKIYLCQIRFLSLTPVVNSKAKQNDAPPSPSDLMFSSENKSNQKAENISRAMTYYLEKLKERETIMTQKSQEYEIGRRHLIKMMGYDPKEHPVDKKTVQKAIDYLLPSGLHSKRARPFLKPPEDYYPESKLESFNLDGRPRHSLFYTGNAKFYDLLYDITNKIINLNKLEDTMNLINNKMKYNMKYLGPEEETSKIDMTGSVLLNCKELGKKLEVEISEQNYDKFKILMEKLVKHPLSLKEQEFVDKFKVPSVPVVKLDKVQTLKKDEQGRLYMDSKAKQRTSLVEVRLYKGTGEIKIDSPQGIFNITFFESITQREQILFPFKVIDEINKYDIEVKVNDSGMSCLAKAIRYATSKALCSFIGVDAIEKLRLAGLLTPDQRRKERNKPGKKGARRGDIWHPR